MNLARGRLLKTKVKETKKVVQAATKAGLEELYKSKNKHLLDEIRFKLVGMIDRIDPLKIAAIVGLTIVCKSVIDLNLKFLGIVLDWNWLTSSPLYFAYRAFFPDEQPPTNVLNEVPEYINWIVAFGIAYIIAENPEIVTEGIGNFVKTLVLM